MTDHIPSGDASSGASQAAPGGAADRDWAEAMAEQASVAHSATDKLLEKFASPAAAGGTHHDIDMVLDIPVQLTVELGRTRIAIKNILQLAQGSVIELDGMAGEPMDVLVNGTLIAQGEVVVVHDKFGIRLTDIITPSERMRKLRR